MRLINFVYSFVVKKFYGRFNGKLFPLVAIPGSYIALFYLLLKKKKNQVVILPTSALGDTLYILSFWENLYKLSNQADTQLVFYLSDRYKRIVETYNPPIDGIVYLKHLGMKHVLLLMLSACLYHSKSVEIARRRNIFGVIPRIHKRWLKKNSFIGTRNQLAHILNMPLDPISYHQLPQVNISAIKDFEYLRNKICVINPYSYSMSYSVSLYERICEKLKLLGYIVYTNVVGEQREINGSIPLRCGIEELYSIACEIPLVVSVRSGVVDFLIPSNTSMFVIYEKWKDVNSIKLDVEGDERPYSLMEWRPKGHVYEAYMEKENDDDKILDEFDKYLKKWNLDV